jgi:glutathione synthase
MSSVITVDMIVHGCRNGNKEVLNKEAGYLLRTKVADSNEGGVAAGYAVLDSLYLI